MTSPLVACIIVNHHQNSETLAQLYSLHHDDPDLFAACEIFVVHNGGPSMECSEPWFHHVKVLRTENRGYGSAINLAAEHARSKTLLALNADLDPLPGFLRNVRDAATAMLDTQGSEQIGVMGFRLLDDDGKPQGSFGPFPTLARMLAGFLRPRGMRKYWRPGDQNPMSVPWLTGACMMIRRDCFDELKGFDERFFMYYEDVDLCKRAWQQHWRVVYDPKPTCRHFQPYHRRPLTHPMARMARRSVLAYFWKHRPRWEFWTLVRIVRFECWQRRSDPGWVRVAEMVERTIANPEEIPKGVP